jgi:hypothetical protein
MRGNDRKGRGNGEREREGKRGKERKGDYLGR